jgi:hypothetical protein
MERYEWANLITEMLIPLTPSGRGVVWKAIQEMENLAQKKDLSVIKNLCNVADTQISLGLFASARETLQQALKE